MHSILLCIQTSTYYVLSVNARDKHHAHYVWRVAWQRIMIKKISYNRIFHFKLEHLEHRLHINHPLVSVRLHAICTSTAVLIQILWDFTLPGGFVSMKTLFCWKRTSLIRASEKLQPHYRLKDIKGNTQSRSGPESIICYVLDENQNANFRFFQCLIQV